MDRKTDEPNKRNVKMDMLVSALLAGVAVIVYGLTMATGVFPGESAALLAAVSGFNPMDTPFHPVFCAITSWFSTLPVSTLPVRMTVFSLICSVLAVVLVYRVVSFFIRDVITEEEASEHAPRVAMMAGALAAVAFLFSAPVWNAATRFHYQSFDALLPLLAAQMLVWFAERQWRVLLVLFAVLCGVGVAETALFIAAIPLLAMFAMYVMWRAQGLSFLRVSWLVAVMTFVTATLFFIVAKQFCGVDGNASDMLLQMLKGYRTVLNSAMPAKGWAMILIVGILPFLTSMLAVFRGLNNERSPAQYMMHGVLIVLVGCALVNMSDFSPWYFLKPHGSLPTGLSVMTAMTAGYLFAYLYLLLKVRSGNRAYHVSHNVRKAGEWFGVIITYPFAVFVVVASLVNIFQCDSKRGMFADRCAKAILDRMGSRTWLVTDGTLDPHLQIMAKERGQELNLICIQRDDSAYLKSLWSLLEERKVFAGEDSQRMKTNLGLGVVSFIQDWFAMDKDIASKVAVFNVPDLWYSAGLTPVPDFFLFSGSSDIQADFKDRKLLDEYMAFWKSMDKDLPVCTKTETERDLLDNFCKFLRRHMGFVANNLGFLLEDLGNEKDALTVYTYVTKSIDPENISALFNRFEMTRRGSDATDAVKEQIEKELKAFLANLKGRQYSLWSLSRHFGYVRSPELFVKLGYGWAVSGDTAAARAAVDTVVKLLPPDQRADAIRTMKTMFQLTGKDETEQIYQDMLTRDPENRSAMHGLIRLLLQQGASDEAKSWLERVAKLDENTTVNLGVEWATIHLMNKDVEKARRILQETTDLQPKNLQAWAMLALLQIQQDELDDVENLTLNRMEKIAGVDNYFVQITRAQMLLRKGPSFRFQARESLIRAAILRPEIEGVKDMILQLDMDMNDLETAERHARQILRANRNHALANYVLGSVRLREGAYGEAEDHLKRSVAAEDLPAALNDLAEVLRRIKRMDEAEAVARKATEKAPTLYIVWETLGAILLEANKNLDEAEQMVTKAIDLLNASDPPGIDPRVQITLARIQFRKDDIESVRETVRQIKTHLDALSPYDKGVLAKLEADIASRRK